MGLLEFNKLPINTLVGADWKTFRAITDGREIDRAWRSKYRLTKAVCRLLSTLAPIQERRYRKLLADKPLEHAPVFILGHWRSGTTFVHNVLSCDKHFGYNTTYQTVFPHLMMFGQGFFKKNMSWLMPDKRPTDNMELAVDLPQDTQCHPHQQGEGYAGGPQPENLGNRRGGRLYGYRPLRPDVQEAGGDERQ